MRLAGIAATLALAFAGPAMAQSEDGGERRLALARQYVDLMQVEDQAREQVAALAGLAAALSSAGSPLRAPAEPSREAQEQALDALMTAALPLMREVMAEAHARVFTEAELEALIAFYAAPLGQGIAGKQAELNRATTAGMQARMPEWIAAMEAAGVGPPPAPTLTIERPRSGGD